MNQSPPRRALLLIGCVCTRACRFPKRRELMAAAAPLDMAAEAAAAPPHEDPDARFARRIMCGYPGVPPAAARALYDLIHWDDLAVDAGRKEGLWLVVKLCISGSTSGRAGAGGVGAGAAGGHRARSGCSAAARGS